MYVWVCILCIRPCNMHVFVCMRIQYLNGIIEHHIVFWHIYITRYNSRTYLHTVAVCTCVAVATFSHVVEPKKEGVQHIHKQTHTYTALTHTKCTQMLTCERPIHLCRRRRHHVDKGTTAHSTCEHLHVYPCCYYGSVCNKMCVIPGTTTACY